MRYFDKLFFKIKVNFNFAIKSSRVWQLNEIVCFDPLQVDLTGLKRVTSK